MKTDKDLYNIVVDKPLDHVTKDDFQYVNSDNLYFINYNARWSMGPYSIAFDAQEFSELSDHDIRVIIQNHINERLNKFKNRLSDSFSFKDYHNIISEVYHPNASEILGK